MPTDQTIPVTTLTPPALRAFLASIIDYAGLFPPAGLPLDEAIDNFARYRTGPDAWMLARFVIPAKRLSELDGHAALFDTQPPFHFSALGTGAADADAFLPAFAKDLEAIAAFHARHPQQVKVDVMEMRLPPDLFQADAPSLHQFFADLDCRAAETLPALDLFFEVSIDDKLRQIAPALLSAMATHNASQETQIGFKMRTGGLEPAAFPQAAHLAYALVACHDAGVHFKATAGLHHPVRQYHKSVQTHMYGFFNLFGAAMLTATHDLDAPTVERILLDEDADHFRFDATGFTWQDLTTSYDDITRLRDTFAISIGSCSFDEPREDLQALGLF
ncbi:MAG TPA: hypothetical protein VKP65_09830 [Rhodothermales bacterium]|nr:hypothetical protein [Rhodothermales bacterium]